MTLVFKNQFNMKSNIISFKIPAFILLILAFSFTSCEKEERRALKDIAGIWNLQSYTINDASLDEVDGTWTFDKCKRRDNNKFLCTGSFDYSAIYMGNSITHNNNFSYHLDITDNDVIEIFLDDIIYEVELSETTMVATVNAVDETHVISFNK